ncbi:hypothetical protein NL676_024124 [Syzygium grande]|nr:hypothetical protein NL676_024124 [Syzygium grande]
MESEPIPRHSDARRSTLDLLRLGKVSYSWSHAAVKRLEMGSMLSQESYGMRSMLEMINLGSHRDGPAESSRPMGKRASPGSAASPGLGSKSGLSVAPALSVLGGLVGRCDCRAGTRGAAVEARFCCSGMWVSS